MDKSEIAYLYTHGFTIEEIKQLDGSLDKLTEEEKINTTKTSESGEVKDEKPEVKEEPKEEKKNSDSSSEVDELKKLIDELTELVQTNNRKGVDNPEPPKPKTIEEIAQEFFDS